MYTPIVSAAPKLGDSKEYTAYTDGCCLGNPGPGGYATIFIDNPNNKVKFSIVESEKYTTNNKMELMGIITAFKYCPSDVKKLTIYSDSTYCIDGLTKWIKGWINRGWKTAAKTDVKNKELWLELLQVSKNVNYELIWVKGHSGVKFNEMADALANYAAKNQN